MLAVLLLATTWAASAQNIVYVNYEKQEDKASLQAAIEASGVALADITRIKVTGGMFFPSDWEYLRTQKDQLSTLATFVITDKVDYVADSHDTQNGGYFSEALRMVRIAKIKRIGKNTFDRFKEKTNLTTVDLPDATSIAQWAFYECKALSSVSLPKATSVGPMAFYDCFSLSDLQLGATPPAVGDDAFENCPSPRYLQLVDADGKALTGDALTAAQAQYRAHAGWEASTNTWYGWSFPSIKVKLNGGNPITGGSLADAIAASGVALEDIESIEVVGGQFHAGDWAELEDKRLLRKFTVTDGADYVANFPDLDYNGFSTYFNGNILQISIAKVKKINENAFGSPSYLFSVSLPDATTIGGYAFQECYRLANVSLPKVTSIDSRAFLDCRWLTQLQLGATPPTVKDDAFENCPSPRYLLLVDADGKALTGDALTAAQAAYRSNGGWDASTNTWYGWSFPSIIKVKLNGGNPITGQSLADAIAASGVALKDITSIEMEGGQFLASDWEELRNKRDALSKLKRFIITDGADFVANSPQIYPNGYFGESLTEVSIAKIKWISEGTFDCSPLPTNLTSVSLPDATSIDRYAFYACTALTSVSLPKVTDIGSDAFNNCTALTSVSLPKATFIDQYAFDRCTALTSVSLPEATYIDYAAFDNCTALTSVSLPKATVIRWQTFNNCTALTSVSLPKATDIHWNAFRGCTALSSVNLPQVSKIGEEAFNECASLSLLQLGATPPTVMANAFNNCPSPRYLLLVDADGNAITGDALATAQGKYKAVNDGNTSDNLWCGWTLATPRIITLDAQNGQIAIEQGAPAGVNAHAVVPELASTVSFKLVPSSGYVAGTVVVFETGNEANKIEVTQSSGTYSFAMPAHGVTIRAQFRKRTYQVRATANPYSAGTVSPSSESYTMGSTVRLEATANEGYRFVRWTKGGAEVSTANPYTFECTGEAELVAVFEKEEAATGLLGIHREGLSVYPNPTSGELWLTVPEPVEGTAEVQVYTASGQLVVRVPAHGASAGSAPAVAGSAPAAMGHIRIDLSGHPAGVYIIRVGHAVAKVVRM